MPNANGRFVGVSLTGIENPWLDSLARVGDHVPEPASPKWENGRNGFGWPRTTRLICERTARFPTDEPPYCACVGARCAKAQGEAPTAYEEAMKREHNR